MDAERMTEYQNLATSVVIQSLSCVRLSATLWTTASQASLSVTASWSLLKLMSTELVMPSNHLILCHLLLLLPSLFVSIRVFSNELALCIRWSRSIRASALELVLPVNIQGWFPCSPRDSQESSPAPQVEGINSSVLSLYGPALTSIHDYWKNYSFD